MKKFQILIKKVRLEREDKLNEGDENGNEVPLGNDEEVKLVIEMSTLDKIQASHNAPESHTNTEKASLNKEESFSITDNPGTTLEGAISEESEMQESLQEENFVKDGEANGILQITENVVVDIHQSGIIDTNENIIGADEVGKPIEAGQAGESVRTNVDQDTEASGKSQPPTAQLGKYRKLATLELFQSHNYTSEIFSLVSSATRSGSSISVGENVNPEGYNLKIMLRKEIPQEFCDNKYNAEIGVIENKSMKIEKFPFDPEKVFFRDIFDGNPLRVTKDEIGNSNTCYLAYHIEALEDINWEDFPINDEVIINYESETFGIGRVNSNLNVMDEEEELSEDTKPTRAKEIQEAIDNAIEVEKEWKTSTGEKKNYEIETGLINIQILDVVEICSKMKVELPLNRRDDLKFDREHHMLKDSDIMEEDGESVPYDLLKKLCTYKIKIIFRHLIQERLKAMNYPPDNLAHIMETCTNENTI